MSLSGVRFASTATAVIASVVLALLGATGCEGDNLGSSCGGSRVELCGPREWADTLSASLEPNELPIADFGVDATVRVELARCGDAPAPHVVDVSAVVPDGMPSSDGGTPVQVTSLLVLMDGADGDVAGDDVIEVEVPNPFISTIEPETDITLRFVARSTTPGGCASGVLEIPYRTGVRR